MNLESYLSHRRNLIEVALNSLLPQETEQPQRLHESLRYSVMAPGKRLRPILVLASCEAIGGDPQDVLPTACAMECIHVFSLIHDDLPCMDDDDFRRGRLTNHKVYGDAMALLAGDALLTVAFELIGRNGDSLPAERIVEAILMIAKATGMQGMVGGQVVDMESENQAISFETLKYIHANKTGALLTASSVVGALLCGATSTQKNALSKYGQSIGLAFQIADDILDIVGDQEKIGKPVGSDEGNNKATYPKLFGLDASLKMAHAEVANAIDALSDFGESAEPLRSIAQYIVDRDL